MCLGELGAEPSRERLRWPLLPPLVAFAAWTLVSVLASERRADGLMGARGLLVLGTFYVMVNALPDAAGARRFATILFGLVAGVSLLAIVQVALCPHAPLGGPLGEWFLRKCGRARGFFSIYMTLAGVITPVLLVTLPRLVKGRRGPPWLVPAWFAGVGAVGVTYVRGAWIALGAGVLVTLVLVRPRLRVAAGLVIVVAALLVVALSLAPGELDRLRLLGSTQDNSTLDRVAMIEAGVAMVRDHPLVGVGLGGVKALYPAYAPDIALRRHTSHLHNTPLQIAAERGVPGLVAWLLVFAAFFRRAGGVLRLLPRERAEDRALVAGCLVAVGAFLVGGLVEYNFGDTEVLLVACVVMALPFVVERDLVGSARAEAPAASGWESDATSGPAGRGRPRPSLSSRARWWSGA